MKISDHVKSLDEITTPVMILDKNGKVIYKNDSCVRCIKLPKRNTHIFAHIDKAGMGEYEKIQKRNKPSVITVNTGERNARALVSKYDRFGEKCSIWIFIPHLQANASSRVFNKAEQMILSAAYQICETVKEIDRLGNLPAGMQGGAIRTRIDKRLEKVLDQIFSRDEETEKNGREEYSLKRSLEILSGATERVYPNFGLSAFVNVEDRDYAGGYLVDYSALSSLYTNLLSFASDATGNSRVDVFFTYDDDFLYYKTVFTLPIPPEYFQNEQDISRLAVLCPRDLLDIIIVRKILSEAQFEASFSVDSSVFDNVSVDIKIPIRYSPKLHSPAFDVEELLLEKDQAVVFAYLLTARTFADKNRRF